MHSIKLHLIVLESLFEQCSGKRRVYDYLHHAHSACMLRCCGFYLESSLLDGGRVDMVASLWYLFIGCLGSKSFQPLCGGSSSICDLDYNDREKGSVILTLIF